MKTTMTCSMFVTEMIDMRQHQISYAGLVRLFEYLEETDPDAEFDPVALFAHFTEYEDLEELEETYNFELSKIEEATVVLKSKTGTYVIEDF